MKVDDAIETLSRFFNDLIGGLVPGVVLAFGLVAMHSGPSKMGALSKLMEGPVSALLAFALLFALGHTLLALFEHAIQHALWACRLTSRFDETQAMARQSYRLFADIVNQLGASTGDGASPSAQWGYNDLRNVALSATAEGAALGRRFMFISLLCNGVGTALVIMSFDFTICQLLSPKLLFQYPEAAPWTMQLALMLGAAWALFSRAQAFHSRAMTTPFSIAIAELQLTKESDAPNPSA